MCRERKQEALSAAVALHGAAGGRAPGPLRRGGGGGAGHHAGRGVPWEDRISLFGLGLVNPGYISSLVVTAELQERITSTHSGSVTSVQNVGTIDDVRKKAEGMRGVQAALARVITRLRVKRLTD